MLGNSSTSPAGEAAESAARQRARALALWSAASRGGAAAALLERGSARVAGTELAALRGRLVGVEGRQREVLLEGAAVEAAPGGEEEQLGLARLRMGDVRLLEVALSDEALIRLVAGAAQEH
jgi:hypothetical protein